MENKDFKQVFICDMSSGLIGAAEHVQDALSRDTRITVRSGRILSGNTRKFDAVLYIADSANALLSIESIPTAHTLLLTTREAYDRFLSSDQDGAGYNYTFIWPADCELIAHRIRGLLFEHDLEFVYCDRYFSNLEQRAGKLLKSLGVPLRLDGYYYLRFALAYTYLCPNALWKTDVYPALQKRYRKSPACFERSMRYAIECAWTHGDIDTQHAIFGYTIDLEKGKPVLRELTARLSDRMHLEDYSSSSSAL